MDTTVLGGGKFGYTLLVHNAKHYPDDQHILFVRETSKGKDGRPLEEYLNDTRRLDTKFPKTTVTLPENVLVISDFKRAVHNQKIVISAFPASVHEPYFRKMMNYSFEVFVCASKGIIPGVGEEKARSIYETFRTLMPDAPYATISGPNIAQQMLSNFEHIDGKVVWPSHATIAFDPANMPFDLVTLLSYPGYFELSHHPDVRSVEACGRLKQFGALAMGLLVGAGAPDNTISSFMQDVGAEIKDIMRLEGLNPNVYDTTKAGVPDLEVTYKSGRHGKVGQWAAELGSFQKALAKTEGDTLEGPMIVAALYSDHPRLKILGEVYAVIYMNRKIGTAIENMIGSKKL